jgi:hypothetical protein
MLAASLNIGTTTEKTGPVDASVVGDGSGVTGLSPRAAIRGAVSGFARLGGRRAIGGTKAAEALSRHRSGLAPPVKARGSYTPWSGVGGSALVMRPGHLSYGKQGFNKKKEAWREALPQWGAPVAMARHAGATP